jgi:hypothetical protein
MSQLSDTVVPHLGNENSRPYNLGRDIIRPLARELNLLVFQDVRIVKEHDCYARFVIARIDVLRGRVSISARR